MKEGAKVDGSWKGLAEKEERHGRLSEGTGGRGHFICNLGDPGLI